MIRAVKVSLLDLDICEYVSADIHSSFISSRRRPNKMESIDQGPGPSIAIAAQTQMSRTPSFGSWLVIKINNA